MLKQRGGFNWLIAPIQGCDARMNMVQLERLVHQALMMELRLEHGLSMPLPDDMAASVLAAKQEAIEALRTELINRGQWADN